jgi:hypothetical protein
VSKPTRKNIRRHVRHPGAILKDGAILSQCTVLDVSATGAKIEIKIPIEIPDEFDLHLSSNGEVRRHCQVVRRTENEIGVNFVF